MNREHGLALRQMLRKKKVETYSCSGSNERRFVNKLKRLLPLSFTKVIFKDLKSFD